MYIGIFQRSDRISISIKHINNDLFRYIFLGHTAQVTEKCVK